MLRRLAALSLLVALSAGVVSGMPAHAGGDECGMHEGADCCKRARGHGGGPGAAAARLCCAVNCQHQGTTGGAAACHVRAPEAVPTHPALPAPAPFSVASRALHARAPSAASAESPPVYLLNLAFLI